MINHFRTRLINLSDVGTPADYICPGYTQATLPTPLQAFHDSVLFPGLDREGMIESGNSYELLLAGCALNEVFYLYDPRITYTLCDLNTFGYENTLLNLTVIFHNSNSYYNEIVNMLNYGVNQPKYLSMYKNAPNDMYRLAGLIANFSYKIK